MLENILKFFNANIDIKWKPQKKKVQGWYKNCSFYFLFIMEWEKYFWLYLARGSDKYQIIKLNFWYCDFNIMILDNWQVFKNNIIILTKIYSRLVEINYLAVQILNILFW